MARSPAPKATGPSRLATGPTGGGRSEADELAEVRAELREARETIEAIRGGGVDSLVSGPPGQEQVYALASADRPYRLFVEAMNEGAATVSPQGVILNANPRLGSMTGQTATELVGTAVLDLIPSAHRTTVARLLDVAAGDSARGDAELTAPGGATVPVLLAVSGLEVEGMLLRCLVLTDLTAQRTAESQAAEAHKALWQQNAFLEQAQASAGLGWWIADLRPNGRFTASLEACRILGLHPGEFDGKTATFLGLVHQDDAPRISDVVAAALTDGAPFHVEHRIVRPDRSVRWVLQSAVVERDETGVAKRMLGTCQDITDRKRIEDELRAAAAYNRSLIEASLDPLATISPGGKITDVNAATIRVTGAERDQLVGTDFCDYFTEPDKAREGYRQVFAQGFIADYPLTIRHTGGSLTDVLYNASVYKDAVGNVLGVFAAARDFTAQKRASQYARSLIEASLDPLVTIGPDGAITDVNTATERVTGRGRAELIGTEFSGYFTEPDLARAGYEQVFRDGSVRDYPLELRHREGHTTPVLYNASVFRDPSGLVLGAFAAARDVTQINRTEAALRESEERLRALFDNALVGISDMEPSGEIVRANPCFCQITGYTADELRSLRLEDIVHPDDVGTDLANFQRLLSGEIDTYSMEKRYLQKGGGVVWAEVDRAVVRDPDGTPLLVVGAVRDVTAQRHAESEVRTLNAELEARVEQRTAELELANKNLERANNNLEAFTYSVSHDLRAPLRALSGFSEALLEEYSDLLDETGRGYALRIQAASERMGTLVNDLLHLSRVSRAEMNLRPVDLSADVAAIAAELQSREPGRRVSVTVQDGVWVTADHALIRTVVQNLIENAWKFTSRRDQALIEFATTTAGDAEVCCFVRDNGAGFDPAYAGKLFQPFQRLHSASEFPGTGIGLASIQRIVERHGGRTWAEGVVDGGATFYFTLGATNPA
jgi:PAS domain S-box-containing protein